MTHHDRSPVFGLDFPSHFLETRNKTLVTYSMCAEYVRTDRSGEIFESKTAVIFRMT